jgi:hypothetical protein
VESLRLFLAAREFERATGIAGSVIGFLQKYEQVTVWTELTREVGDALPSSHDEKVCFVCAEGDGLVALGFTSRALERNRTSVEIRERLAAQEPDRADYAVDLANSLGRTTSEQTWDERSQS